MYVWFSESTECANQFTFFRHHFFSVSCRYFLCLSSILRMCANSMKEYWAGIRQPPTLEGSPENWAGWEVCSLISNLVLLILHSVPLTSRGQSCWWLLFFWCYPRFQPKGLEAVLLRSFEHQHPWAQGSCKLFTPWASEPCLQTALSAPSQLGPLGCLWAQSPLISFMDVVNHSTHHEAEEKPDLLDLPTWFFPSNMPVLNDFSPFNFFFFFFLNV